MLLWSPAITACDVGHKLVELACGLFNQGGPVVDLCLTAPPLPVSAGRWVDGSVCLPQDRASPDPGCRRSRPINCLDTSSGHTHSCLCGPVQLARWQVEFEAWFLAQDCVASPCCCLPLQAMETCRTCAILNALCSLPAPS